MLKLCGCFKSNNNEHKKHKEINKNNTIIKSNDMKDLNFGLFLTGDDESGKTKLIAELVASHDPFTVKEKILKTTAIERYIHSSLTDILRVFEQSDPPVPLEYPENRQSIIYILTTARETDFEYPFEFFQHVELLWTDAGLQTFLKNTTKYRLSESTKYFLDRVNKIRDPDYIPTTEDMIYSRLFPTHTFKMIIDLDSERVCFNLVEMDLLAEEQQNSIQSFIDNTHAIIFITDCSSFNVMTHKKKGQTLLHQSLELFRKIRSNKLRQTKSVILLLNKQDLLANKIKNGIRLEDYFPESTNYVPTDVETPRANHDGHPDVIKAKYFIRDQFRKFSPNCYCHFTSDRDVTTRLIFVDCSAIFEEMLL